jgi:DNA/RNA endonuclease YhcR with UshA esterase domain
MDGDWSNPVNEETQNTFGNQYITESNLLTIAQLKSKYSSVIDGGSYEQVSKPTQIKGIVTGNDVEGNIYNEISLQDETGAILVCIAQGGLFGYLPIGQEILIELEGLYVGGYGKMAEIGTLYTSATGSTYVSRMSRATWNNHFRILSSDNPVTPMEVTNVGKLDFEKDAGKLITLRGVQLQDANGTATFAPKDGSVTLTANCANRAFVGISSSKLVLRTSTYSDFANAVMPTGTIDVTGIFTRYNNTWQILLRKESDIQPSSYTPEPPAEPKGDGT